MPSLFAPAGLMVSVRLFNLGVGLLYVPILIHYFHGEGFGAWAILLASSVAFSTLEFGMPATLVKHAAVPLQASDRREASAVRSHVLLILAASYAAWTPLVVLGSQPLARLVGLPDTPHLGGAALFEMVFLAVALRGILQTGTYLLYAERRFRAVAAVYLLQSVGSHGAAIAAAAATQRVDLALFAFWGAQLIVSGAAFVATSARFDPILATRIEAARLRALFVHGFKVQVDGWTQVINYQFDKFVIAAVVGIYWVSPYEVANRSVVALRSVPASGVDTFLPAAAATRGSFEDKRLHYLEMTRLAAFAAVAFMLAPLVASPIFLYSWTGEMGYISRWAFVALLLGATANVLTLPARTIVQAEGHAGIQATASVASALANVPLSLALVYQFGLVGGAIGTSIAMILGAAVLLVGLHRRLAWPMAPTLRLIGQFWPSLAIAAVLGILAYLPFDAWLAEFPRTIRYAKEMRIIPALIAGVLYALALAVMMLVQVHRTGLTAGECAYLTSRVRFKWFVSYCNRCAGAAPR